MERRPTPMHCQVRPAEIMRQAIPPRAPIRPNERAGVSADSYRRRALPDSDFSARCLAAHGRDTILVTWTKRSYGSSLSRPSSRHAGLAQETNHGTSQLTGPGRPAARVGQSARPARPDRVGGQPSVRQYRHLACAGARGRIARHARRADRPRKVPERRGPVLALQRFAAALCARAAPDAPADAEPRRKARPGWPHANRLRNRTCSACAPHACRASASAGAPRSRPTARPAVDASLHLNMQACRCTAREPCNG